MSTKALFANQREANLASTVALVEEVLRERGISPAADNGVYRLAANARLAFVNRSEFTHIRITDVVMTLDDKVDRPELFADLLETNAGMCGAAFATDGDRVILVSERTTLDLDKSEVVDLIERVLNYASQHAPVLVARYGGRAGT